MCTWTFTNPQRPCGQEGKRTPGAFWVNHTETDREIKETDRDEMVLDIPAGLNTLYTQNFEISKHSVHSYAVRCAGVGPKENIHKELI